MRRNTEDDSARASVGDVPAANDEAEADEYLSEAQDIIGSFCCREELNPGLGRGNKPL